VIRLSLMRQLGCKADTRGSEPDKPVTGQSYAKCNHHIAPSEERQQRIQVSYGIRFDGSDLAIAGC
jgi:hypothetical protein